MTPCPVVPPFKNEFSVIDIFPSCQCIRLAPQAPRIASIVRVLVSSDVSMPASKLPTPCFTTLAATRLLVFSDHGQLGCKAEYHMRIAQMEGGAKKINMFDHPSISHIQPHCLVHDPTKLHMTRVSRRCSGGHLTYSIC